jgi:hypothetical protein
MNYFRPLVTAVMLLFSAACTHHYTPTADRPFEPITEFSSTKSVELRNGQRSKADFLWLRAGVHKHYGTLDAWTNVAMEIAARELKKRGLTVTTGVPKSITMSVESAKTDVGFVEIKAHIDLRVQTSDGYSAVYIGENSSYVAANLHRQIDGALMRAVREMFMDPRIVAFLTQ